MRDASSPLLVIAFGLLVFAIVTVPLRMADGAGLPRYRALSAELAKTETDNERIEREIREMAALAERLRTDPRALERIARDELGMVRSDELVFQFPND
jgi:cell division protein FtsB